MSSFDTFVTNPPAGAPTPDETRGGLRLAWLGLAWARFAFYTRQHWTERCSAPCSARGSSPLCLPHFVRMGRRLAFEGCVRAGACLPLVVRFRLRGVRFCLVRLFCPLWWSKLCTKLVGRPGDRRTAAFTSMHVLFAAPLMTLLSPLPSGTVLRSAQHMASFRMALEDASDGESTLQAQLSTELEKRGIKTALQQMEIDGPSAFKDPRMVVEFVMLSLQHQADSDGIVNAFAWTMPPMSERSATHGTRSSIATGTRIAWTTGRTIEGTPTGPAVGYKQFETEIREHYAPLLGCAVWRFAQGSCSSSSAIPGNEHKGSRDSRAEVASKKGWNNKEEGWVKQYHVIVDDRTNAVFSLVYDWGAVRWPQPADRRI